MKDFKLARWFYCILAASFILIPLLALAGVTTVNHGAGSTNAVSVDAMGGGLYVKAVGPGAYNGSVTQGNYAVEYQPAAPLVAGNLLQVSFTGAAFDGSAINACGNISLYASAVPPSGTGLFNFVLTNNIGAGNFVYFTNGSCNAQPGSYGLPVKLLATTNSAWTTVKVDAVSAGNILIDPSSAANLVWIAPSSNTATIFTEYAVPTAGSQTYGITSGPDGNLWFTELSVPGNRVGRITTAGVITEYAVPTAGSQPTHITSGPDGNIWFTEQTGNKIGKLALKGLISAAPTSNNFGNANVGITSAAQTFTITNTGPPALLSGRLLSLLSAIIWTLP